MSDATEQAPETSKHNVREDSHVIVTTERLPLTTQELPLITGPITFLIAQPRSDLDVLSITYKKHWGVGLCTKNRTGSGDRPSAVSSTTPPRSPSATPSAADNWSATGKEEHPVSRK